MSKKIKIWTLSLWDLKLQYGKDMLYISDDLNFVPMGFETLHLHKFQYSAYYLNFVPMGFETFLHYRRLYLPRIWTLSLWDLKRVCIDPTISLIIIWTLSLWDLKLKKLMFCFDNWLLIWTLSLWDLKLPMKISKLFIGLYLNFVPMGFETMQNEPNK